MSREPTLESVLRGDSLALMAGGTWTAPHAAGLELIVDRAEKLSGRPAHVDIDVANIAMLDTFGAWLIERLRRTLAETGSEPRLRGLSARHAQLIDEVRKVVAAEPEPPPRSAVVDLLETTGKAVVQVGATMTALADMTGAVVAASLRVVAHPSRLRITSTVHHLEQVCWRAVPIVVLMTFLIGAIIAQQGIFHFRKFGADVFVVDMLGVLVLREIGVLLVAIMVAGRSGSAYTAELGSMKMREEIDALQTMGFDATEVLILPRILALMIALPILTFLGAIAALYGGGLVAWFYGGLQPEAFLARLREAISIDHFTVGMIKAPFMAGLIGVIACVEGLAVKGSAKSLGQRTTASVVKSIFFVIVLDGAFAIFFASIGM